jgi:hypothetical protein
MEGWGTYHVACLRTGTGEDEDGFRAAARLAVFELAASVGAELAGYEGGCFWGGEGDGRGRCQAGEHGEG